MFWNYRVIKTKHKSEQHSYETYAIYEVYYDSDEEIEAISEKELCPFGESVEELKRDFELMKKAFDKDVLDYEQVCNKFNKQDVDEM